MQKAWAGKGYLAGVILFVMSLGKNGKSEGCLWPPRRQEIGLGSGIWGRSQWPGGSALGNTFSVLSHLPQLRDKERQMIKERFKVSWGPLPSMAPCCCCRDTGLESLSLGRFYFHLFWRPGFQ